MGDETGTAGGVLTGGCQCGAVRFRAARLMDNPHVCHCRMCQKATGNFFAALVGVKHADLTWTRGAAAEFESSEGTLRGFCRDCGTPLFFRRRAGGHVSLCIGAFDRPAGIPLAFAWGVESRLPQVVTLMGLSGWPSESDVAGAARAKSGMRQHPDHDTDHWPPLA
jgi:hypothetical protein